MSYKLQRASNQARTRCSCHPIACARRAAAAAAFAGYRHFAAACMAAALGALRVAGVCRGVLVKQVAPRGRGRVRGGPRLRHAARQALDDRVEVGLRTWGHACWEGRLAAIHREGSG
jgi:hypothetical protein